MLQVKDLIHYSEMPINYSSGDNVILSKDQSTESWKKEVVLKSLLRYFCCLLPFLVTLYRKLIYLFIGMEKWDMKV